MHTLGNKKYKKNLKKINKSQFIKIILFLCILFFLTFISFVAVKKQPFSYNSRAASENTKDEVIARFIQPSLVSDILVLNPPFISPDPVGEATVVFAKQHSNGGYTVVSGFLYDKNKLITARHTNIDPSWIYTFGPDYGSNFTKGKSYSDIDHVVSHESLDISVVVLKNNSLSKPLPVADSVAVGEKVQVGSSRQLSWRTFEKDVTGLGKWAPECVGKNTENCACYVENASICIVREINKNYPTNSIFTAPFGILVVGDSGAVATQNEKAVGIAFGEVKTWIFDPGRTTFVNITLPEVRVWIDSVK